MGQGTHTDIKEDVGDGKDDLVNSTSPDVNDEGGSGDDVLVNAARPERARRDDADESVGFGQASTRR